MSPRPAPFPKKQNGTRREKGAGGTPHLTLHKSAPRTSPLHRLFPVLAAFDATAAPSRERWLAVHDKEPVVGKDGIEFAGRLWWHEDLRPLVALPPASKGKRPRLRLLYDEAARSREMLDEVIVHVIDKLGSVSQRVQCTLRSRVQSAAERDRARRAQRSFESDMAERRARAERTAAGTVGGPAAETAQRDIQQARARQAKVKRTRMINAANVDASNDASHEMPNATSAAETHSAATPPSKSQRRPPSGTPASSNSGTPRRSGKATSKSATASATPPTRSMDRFSAYLKRGKGASSA